MYNRKRETYLIALAVLLASCLSVTPARSDVIYSSLDPGDTFTYTSALVVGTMLEGPTTPPPPQTLVATQWGFSFTPSFDATLDSIKFAAYNIGGDKTLNVILMSSAGGVPGTALETLTFPELPSSGSLYTVTSSLHPALNQGTQYWVVLAPSTNGLIAWYENESLPGPLAARRDLLATDTNWFAVSALHPTYFSVEGTPVPVPGALWLLGSGLVGLVALRRRIKK